MRPKLATIMKPEPERPTESASATRNRATCYWHLVIRGIGSLLVDRERLKGNLDLLLLSILAAGPAHGYAIISALRERSEGTFDLPEGTIYPALHRLEEAGLLASTWAQAEGRRRRVYGLTDEGAAALAVQRTEWRKFARGVQAVLGKPALGAPVPGRPA
jgi:PadR family transcriptional regulator